MKLRIQVKGKNEPIVFKGDRIDILDFQMNGVKYKQIRYFRKGFSKSEYIDESLIKRITEVKNS
ncbi:hypothetical protein [Clostridium paraputrificum]|uniref:hypothetical protein n=1 Tax=Clostridium paraputrificum TaxID=29363 RepID=UPI00189E819A|nr:hypothetical protein [Clostridium paraputrificum]